MQLRGDKHQDDGDDDDDDEGEDQVGAKFLNMLANEVQQFTSMPMNMGLRKVDLAHKVACVAQSIAFECSTREDLLRYVSEIKSFTTDLGVESGLASFVCHDIANMLPAWLQQRYAKTSPDCEHDVHIDKTNLCANPPQRTDMCTLSTPLPLLASDVEGTEGTVAQHDLDISVLRPTHDVESFATPSRNSSLLKLPAPASTACLKRVPLEAPAWENDCECQHEVDPPAHPHHLPVAAPSAWHNDCERNAEAAPSTCSKQVPAPVPNADIDATCRRNEGPTPQLTAPTEPGPTKMANRQPKHLKQLAKNMARPDVVAHAASSRAVDFDGELQQALADSLAENRGVQAEEAQEYVSLQQEAAKRGMTLKKVLGDGLCQWRALAECINAERNAAVVNHVTLRNQIVQHLEGRLTDWIEFLVAADDGTPQAYLNEIANGMR